MPLNTHCKGAYRLYPRIYMHMLFTYEFFACSVCTVCALMREVSVIACAAALMHFIKVNERQRGPPVPMVNII